MKRVLILNGDSFVGERVIHQFYAAQEYEVEITQRSRTGEGEGEDSDALAFRKRTSPAAGDTTIRSPVTAFSRLTAGGAAADLLRTSHKAAGAAAHGGGAAALASPPSLRSRRSPPPGYLTPYVTAVIPAYEQHPLDFCTCVLENDIIVAVVDGDPTEAECAIKALMNSHYEVEKTFVLVSSALTWANTLIAERTAARQARLRQREDDRRAFWEEQLAELEADGAEEGSEEVARVRARLTEPAAYARDEELPAELREPVEDLSDEELVPTREFSEEEYATRVPHPRYQDVKTLEHVVKRANSATLHTYVLFAGLPYGCGEGPLYGHFLTAYQHAVGGEGSGGGTLASSLLHGLPVIGANVVPMIHVEDLAAIVFKVGSAYAVQEDRYLFAVDRGNLSVSKMLQAIDARLGNGEVPPLLPLPSTTGEAAAAAVPPKDAMTRYLDACLPAPPTIEDLRARYGDDTTHPLFGSGSASDALRCFFLSDIRAEPSAVFAFLPEESWIALDGFAAAIDKVVLQFKKRRGLLPCRVLVTGPPMTGSETVAISLASQYGVPFLTIDSVTAEFEAHVAAMRAELVRLLATRVQRCWDRAHYRRVKEVMAEREETAARKAEEKAERQRLKDEAREARRAAAGKDYASDEEDEEEDSTKHSPTSDAVGEGEAATSELSLVFSEDAGHTQQRLTELLTERYIQGYTEDMDDGDVELAPEDDEDAVEDENLFAQAEEDAAQEEAEQAEEGNAGATRGRLRALASIREAELQEQIRIRALRLAYRLALKAMSMKLVNGALPRPKKDEEEEEDEEDEGSEAAGGHGDNDSEDADEEDESNGGADEDEDEDEEEADEDESAVGDAASPASLAPSTGKKTQRKGVLRPHHTVVEYLDEAKAFFMRWRLRRPDCRNRGYVLHHFPSTVRQACLLYRASGSADDEEGEGEGEPLLFAPAAVEDVPAPVDADFPFLELDGMSEEERAELEEELRTDHLRLVDPRDEGVLAAVQESTFPDHVLVLDDKDETLQALAAAMSEEKKRDCAALPPIEQHGGLSRPNNERGTHRQSGDRDTSPPVAVDGQRSQSTDHANSGATPMSSPTTAAPGLAEKQLQRQREEELRHVVDSFLLTGDAFYSQLSAYRKHHGVAGGGGPSPAAASLAAPPTESLITWLQSVQTREVVGATAERILFHGGKNRRLAASDMGGEDGGDEGDEDPFKTPPPTTRSAQVDILPAPPRDAATMRQELFAVLSRAGLASAHHPATSSSNGATLPGFSQTGQPLQWLADKLTRSILPTPPQEAKSATLSRDKRHQPAHRGDVRIAGTNHEESVARSSDAPLDNSGPLPHRPVSAGPAVDEELESAVLAHLRQSEAGFREELAKREEADVRCERNALRHAQLKEECLGVWATAELPKETYLMKYVIPHLTPAIQEVVRLRPDDPVTTLADLLFNYTTQQADKA